jgi:hypothetical protein
MRRFGEDGIATLRNLLVACALLAAASPIRAEAPAALPDFVGTWHVLIHYQVVDGPHPDRWKWDERVWIIEPSGDGIEWIEHAIVHFEDQSGRFEALGTPNERRLLGRWEPNAVQRQQIQEGLTVSSRGMRRKHLERVGPGHWRSASDRNTIGRSASGIGYVEVWSIESRDGATEFSIDPRVSVSALGDQESTGVIRYVADRVGTSRFQGDFARGGDRRGRFRADATKILVPEVRQRSILTRPIPTPMGTIQLVPDTHANNRVPLLITVLRPFHYYSERRIVIDSTPAGAELDLAYLRRGSQLMYRRGRAPLEVVLPTRLQTAPADRILVRGFLPGHERTRRSVSVESIDEDIHLVLQPLPNQIVGVAHGSLGGRSVLELRSREIPTVRVAEDGGGWTVVLVRTGMEARFEEQIASLRDPQLAFEARQIGDDLVLRVAGTAAQRAGLSLRHHGLRDPVRGESRTRLEIDGPAANDRATRLLAAVDAMSARQLEVCDDSYDRALRDALSERELSGLLGRDDHPYRATLRAALRRLAAVSPEGSLHTVHGETIVPGTPLEFELAWSRSAEIEGYLSWLASLSERLEPEDGGALALRSLLAPSWSPGRFDGLLDTARSARRSCREARAQGPSSPG